MAIANVHAKWENGVLRWYDANTYETVFVHAPVWFKDDFCRATLGKEAAGDDMPWNTTETALNTAIAITDDISGGVVPFIIDNDNNAEVATLDFGNVRMLDCNDGLNIEFRVNLATSIAAAGGTAVWGIAGDYNAVPDTVSEGAWFRLDTGSDALKVETDDTTNDNDDVATGVTMVNGTYYVCRIDCTTITDVKFYVDGVRVAAATTFDMSNLTAAEARMQPYFSVVKTANVGVARLDLDLVSFWSGR